MKRAQIRSVCECQAGLGAELDERHFVLKGWARNHRSGKIETSPAHSIHADKPQFQVAWYCPFCVRNTLRSFDASALQYAEGPPPPASPSIAPAPPVTTPQSVAPPSIVPSTAATPSVSPPRP